MINNILIQLLNELYFFISNFYFHLNIFILLTICQILIQCFYNVILINLSIIIVFFLFFITSFKYDLNIDLYLGFKLNSFYIFIFYIKKMFFEVMNNIYDYLLEHMYMCMCIEKLNE